MEKGFGMLHLTMVPSRNLLQEQYINNYGGCMAGHIQGSATTPTDVKYMLRSDPATRIMAEDESRTSSFNEAGSSRHIQEEKDGDDADDEGEERDMGWLQLGIGSHVTRAQASSQSRGLIELDLFTDRNPTAPIAPTCQVTEFRSPQPLTHAYTTPIPTIPLYLPHTGSSLSFRQQPELGWGYRHGPWSPAASSSTPYYSQQFQQPYMIGAPPPAAEVGTSFGVRVVDAPPRPKSGVWFVLQASQNQGKEPFLPQIPKSYLRIKDGRMTVRVVMKYLANKLGLNNESEVEITCKGQRLLPYSTLQHVRDNIWASRNAVTLLPDSTSPDHMMILHYGR